MNGSLDCSQHSVWPSSVLRGYDSTVVRNHGQYLMLTVLRGSPCGCEFGGVTGRRLFLALFFLFFLLFFFMAKMTSVAALSLPFLCYSAVST